MFKLKSEPIVIRGENNRWRATPPHEVFAVILAGLEDVPVIDKTPDIDILVYDFLMSQDDREYTIKFIWDRDWDRTMIQCYDHTNELALGTSVAKKDILPTFQSILECVIEHTPLSDIDHLITFEDTKKALLGIQNSISSVIEHIHFNEAQIDIHEMDMRPLFDAEKGKLSELKVELNEYERKCFKIKAKMKEHEDNLSMLSDQMNNRVKGLNTMRKVYNSEASTLGVLKKYISHYGGIAEHKKLNSEESEE